VTCRQTELAGFGNTGRGSRVVILNYASLVGYLPVRSASHRTIIIQLYFYGASHLVPNSYVFPEQKFFFLNVSFLCGKRSILKSRISMQIFNIEMKAAENRSYYTTDTSKVTAREHALFLLSVADS
jgi:hypothetical protein